MNYTLDPKPYTLIIGWLYPDLMSTYGDRGNIICLVRRCQWRGIQVEMREAGLETSREDLKNCDLLFMGGAQDRQQKLAAQDLRENKGPVIREMVEGGTCGLFVCAAYQFLGHYYRPAEGEDIPGLGIFDLHTIHPGSTKPRCIGNIVIQFSIFNFQFSNYLVGFENHGGRTYLGKGAKPLGEVVVGYGNNGEDRTEGVIYKNAFGTYLHGPVLPKNPHFADLLIKLSLEKKYGPVKLLPLDDTLEWQAHQTITQRLGVKV